MRAVYKTFVLAVVFSFLASCHHAHGAAKADPLDGWWETRCNRAAEWVERFQFDPDNKTLTVMTSWVKHGGKSGVIMQSYAVPHAAKGGALVLHKETNLPHWELTVGKGQTVVRKTIGKDGKTAVVDTFSRPTKDNDRFFVERAFKLRPSLNGIVVARRKKFTPLFGFDAAKGILTPLAPELTKAVGNAPRPLTFYAEHRYATDTLRADMACGNVFALLDWAEKKVDVWANGKKIIEEMPFRIQAEVGS